MSDLKPPDPGQAIQKANPAAAVTVGRAGVALQTLDELLRFAKMCVDGKVAPRGMETPAAAAIAIQAGMERGLGPLGGLQAAIVINGVLSWRGWAAVGFIQNSGVCVPGTFKSWVENPATDQAVGHCLAQRRGYSEPFHRTFSVADAKKAGLWKKGGPWDSRPDNMIEWRAIGDMGRFHFGDVLGGFPIAEDVEAGGIGPVGGPRELPSEARPAPPSFVKDPILAELAAGSAPQTVMVEATLVQEPEMAPAVRQEIDKSVDEAFPVGPLPPTEVVQTATGIEMRTPRCPRCKALLNAMMGCDVCGHPGADNGERP
jgi:hypothetical protein